MNLHISRAMCDDTAAVDARARNPAKTQGAAHVRYRNHWRREICPCPAPTVIVPGTAGRILKGAGFIPQDPLRDTFRPADIFVGAGRDISLCAVEISQGPSVAANGRSVIKYLFNA